MVNVYPEMRTLAFTAAWKNLVGIDYITKSQARQLAATYMDFVKGLFTFPIYVPGTAFYKVIHVS